MRPGNAITICPASRALFDRGLAHVKPAHDGRGCFFNRNPIPSLGLAEVTFAELPPNLRGLRASPFFSRPYVDDLRHFVSSISVTRNSEIGMEAFGKWPKRIWRSAL